MSDLGEQVLRGLTRMGHTFPRPTAGNSKLDLFVSKQECIIPNGFAAQFLFVPFFFFGGVWSRWIF